MNIYNNVDIKSPNNDAEIGPNDILNDFCLLQIFNRLDLNDLCNTSDVNHQFRRVSKMLMSGPGPYAKIKYPEHFELLIPDSTASCETFFRRVLCKFGDSIKSMELRHLEECEPNDDFSIGELVSTFCSGVLEELKLNVMRLKCDDWAKPLFSSLKTLIFHCHGFDGNIEGLFSECQELKTLRLSSIPDTDPLSTVARKYCKLEELRIGEFVSAEMTFALLQMNQQIKKLDMYDRNRMINDMASKMVGLEQLVLRNVLPGTFSSDPNVPQLAGLKSLKVLELHHDSPHLMLDLSPVTATDVGPNFSAAVEASLKNVSFDCFKWFNCPPDLQFTKGIAKLMTLKRLTLTGISLPFDDCLAEFGEKLPLLRELELGFDYHKEPLLSIGCLIKFVKRSTKLNTLVIHTFRPELFDQQFYDTLLADIQKERQLKITIFCKIAQPLQIHSNSLEVKFVQECIECPCIKCAMDRVADLFGQGFFEYDADQDSDSDYDWGDYYGDLV